MLLSILWLPFLIATFLALVIAPLVIRLAWKWQMVDDPQHHKHAKVVHTYPVPRGGGLITTIAIIIPALFFLPHDSHLLGILSALIIATLVGLADDRWNISPYFRLGANFATALCIVGVGIGIAFINNPFTASIIDLSWLRLPFAFGDWQGEVWVLSTVFALVWLVAMMNIVGQGAGGVEGQLPGVVVIAAITVAILSLQFSADITQWPVITLAAITAGAYLGFLPWNFFPQKIMPGYSGKSTAGLMLGLLALLSTAKVGVLLVVLGVPIIDTLWTYLRRIYQGKLPLWGDRGHLHHRLLDVGLSKQKVVYLYWGATALLGLIAVNLNSQQKVYALLTLALLIGGLLLRLSNSKKK